MAKCIKKRLRKKKHINEYACSAIPFSAKIDLTQFSHIPEDCKDRDVRIFDDFLDIFDDVEGTHCGTASNCECGDFEHYKGVLELGIMKNNPFKKLEEFKENLKRYPFIMDIKYGKIFDSWYGSFDKYPHEEE